MNPKTKIGCTFILLATAGMIGDSLGKNIKEERLNESSELERSQEEANRLRKKLEIMERSQEEEKNSIFF